MRGKMGGGEKMGGKFDRDDSATLRVTNVSEFAEEQDLRDMFSRYGHVTRVFLAKDRETGRAKGFAFISYADRSDAAKACEKMDGCKCFDRVCSLRTLANVVQSVSITLSCASSLPRRLKRTRHVALRCVALRVTRRHVLYFVPGSRQLSQAGWGTPSRVLKSRLGALRSALGSALGTVCVHAVRACCSIMALF
jgi:hypothetical protein